MTVTDKNFTYIRRPESFPACLHGDLYELKRRDPGNDHEARGLLRAFPRISIVGEDRGGGGVRGWKGAEMPQLIGALEGVYNNVRVYSQPGARFMKAS